MALVSCKECGKQISSSARTCPSCGKRQGSHPIAVLFLSAVGVLVLLFIVGLASSPSGSSGDSYTKRELCDQSGEAAHYIAAMSTSSDDVVRVTDQAIAERRFPALGDKVTASIGAVVALSRSTQTPDEIASALRSKCEAQ
jgi:hypothetical protein